MIFKNTDNIILDWINFNPIILLTLDSPSTSELMIYIGVVYEIRGFCINLII